MKLLLALNFFENNDFDSAVIDNVKTDFIHNIVELMNKTKLISTVGDETFEYISYILETPDISFGYIDLDDEYFDKYINQGICDITDIDFIEWNPLDKKEYICSKLSVQLNDKFCTFSGLINDRIPFLSNQISIKTFHVILSYYE